MSDFFATYPLAGTLLIVSLCGNVGLLMLAFLRGCEFEISAALDDAEPAVENRTVHVWKADGSYEQRSFSRPAVKGFQKAGQPWPKDAA